MSKESVCLTRNMKINKMKHYPRYHLVKIIRKITYMKKNIVKFYPISFFYL